MKHSHTVKTMWHILLILNLFILNTAALDFSAEAQETGTAATDDVYGERRAEWLRIAEKEKPELTETVVRPVCLVKAVEDNGAFQGWRMEKCGEVSEVCDKSFKNFDSFTLDFGRHLTGHFTLRFRTLSRVQDGPVRLRCSFSELPAEMNTPLDPFPGTLSRAWMQDEVITIFDVTTPVTIERRLSGRYMKIERLADSPDFDYALDDVWFTATSSAGELRTGLAEGTPEIIRQINNVAVKTLAECMQTVYEDGPKRDQRLWIGDLYLESLANAHSFKQHGLTKRCLYLLAGLSSPDGRLWANVFERPEPHPQVGSYCLTYSLLFNVALLEYAKKTGDMETARDLWRVAKMQTDDALSYLDGRGIFDRHKKGGFVWLFMDWRDGLEESTAMQGLTAFAVDKTYELAELVGEEKAVAGYPATARKMRVAARKHLYDKSLGLYVSGPDRQVSWISQVWAIIGGIARPEEGRGLIERVAQCGEAVRIGSPYGNHYLVEAMIASGMKDEARDFVIDYWGGMVRKGADTFWEVYDPEDDWLSPYRFFPLNSACHAWSCTPVYFIHKYPEIFQCDGERASDDASASGSSFLKDGSRTGKLRRDNIGGIVAAMTLAEKARLLNGASEGTLHGLDYVANSSGAVPGAAGPTAEFPQYGIPQTIMADGPAGLRISPVRDGDAREYWCTAFPVGSALAASWNTGLVRKMCRAMGEEAYANGVDVLLGPSMNIMRNPLCGRNFEYMSEDPVLGGIIAAAYVNGIQDSGVGACLKHFAANNQETNRDGNDVIASENTLQDIYYRTFGIALRHCSPLTVMTSYNKINGTFCCESSVLLEGVLRKQLGFKGMVMTDWIGRRNTAAQVLAGNDLIMPGSQEQIDDIVRAVRTGELPVSAVNRNAERILKYVTATPSFRKAAGEGCGDFGNGEYDAEAYEGAAREMASEAMVLLRNNGALPFKHGVYNRKNNHTESNIKAQTDVEAEKSNQFSGSHSVNNPDSAPRIALYGLRSYDLIAGGTGSGHVNCREVSQIDKALENRGFTIDAPLRELYRTHLANEWSRIRGNSAWVLLDFGHPMIPEMPLEAVTISARCAETDAAVVTIGRSAGEASDRSLYGHYRLSAEEISALHEICDCYHSQGKPVVVVLNVDGAMEMSGWDSLPDAVLLAWLPGQEGGEAVADILCGRVNPSGRLPFSLTRSYWDNASARNFPAYTAAVPQPYMGFQEIWTPSRSGRDYDFTVYEEGTSVGYRYLLEKSISAAYPFGFGLNYTTFSYSDIHVRKTTWKQNASDKGQTSSGKGQACIEINCTVTNTGNTSGKEVVQLYATAPDGKFRELKSFHKTSLLRPGESETVKLQLAPDDLAAYDETAGQRQVAEGKWIVSLCTCAETVLYESIVRISEESL